LKKQTFEQAMLRLEQINGLLSDSETGFDESLKLFKEASELIVFCNDKINNAKLTIEEYTKNVSEAVGDGKYVE